MHARVLRRTIPVAAALAVLATLPAHALSTTTVVACGGDIVGAISTANANPGPDTVKLARGCTYVLTSTGTDNGLPLISSDLSIVGNGATVLRNSVQKFRIMEVGAGVTVTISRLTISGGQAADVPAGSPGSGGGGILNLGTLTLNNCRVTGNIAGLGGAQLGGFGNGGGAGGGIHNQGTLRLIGSSVSSNTGGRGSFGGVLGGSGGSGGGIGNTGTLTVRRSTIGSNVAGDAGSGSPSGTPGTGGGIANFAGGAANISDSKIVNNFTGYSDSYGSGDGGGIYNNGNHMNPIRTTIKSNLPNNCKPAGTVSHCPN